MFWGIDIKKGIVTHDEISFIKEDFKSKNDSYSFKEDMLQINFSGDIILDVGWLPSFEKKGNFQIYVIKDINWENPIVNEKAKSISSLKIKLQEIINSLA